MTETRIVYDKDDSEIRAAVISAEGELLEFAVHRDSITGQIFKARVSRQLDDIQAFFADTGNGRQVFVNCADLVPQRMPRIGEYLLLQVTRDGENGKAPAASGKIKIAGEYLVYLPYGERSGISRNISDADSRERIRAFLKDNSPKRYIARSAAQETDEIALAGEAATLESRWQEILRRFFVERSARLLFREYDFVLKYYRDMAGRYLVRGIITNDSAISKQLNEAGLSEQISRQFVKGDLFSLLNIENSTSELYNRKLTLPNGVEIVFDVCEALTAIDVNSSGYYSGECSPETATQVNRLAATAIARQIRLRHLGGIIVTDFLRMPESGCKEIEEIMRNNLAADSEKSDVLGFTRAGLLEILRKKSPYSAKK